MRNKDNIEIMRFAGLIIIILYFIIKVKIIKKAKIIEQFLIYGQNLS